MLLGVTGWEDRKLFEEPLESVSHTLHVTWGFCNKQFLTEHDCAGSEGLDRLLLSAPVNTCQTMLLPVGRQ